MGDGREPETFRAPTRAILRELFWNQTTRNWKITVSELVSLTLPFWISKLSYEGDKPEIAFTLTTKDGTSIAGTLE